MVGIFSFLSSSFILSTLVMASSNVILAFWATGNVSTDLTPGILETIILTAWDVPSQTQPGTRSSTILMAAWVCCIIPAKKISSADSSKML
jgi:hypothetical protein